MEGKARTTSRGCTIDYQSRGPTLDSEYVNKFNDSGEDTEELLLDSDNPSDNFYKENYLSILKMNSQGVPDKSSTRHE